MRPVIWICTQCARSAPEDHKQLLPDQCRQWAKRVYSDSVVVHRGNVICCDNVEQNHGK